MNDLSTRQQWFKDLIAQTADGDIKAFAAKSGVDRTTLSLIVNGHKEPSDKHVIRVANRLNLRPPEEVLSYAPKAKTAEPPPPEQDRTAEQIARIGKELAELAVQIKTMNELMLMVLDKVKKA